MKRFLPATLLLLAGLAACSDGTGSNPPLTNLTVSPAPAYTQVGDTVHLAVTGTDESGETITPNASFRSANPQVATVNGNGVVKGVSVGTTQITAEAGGASETITVNVLAAGTLLSLNVNPNTTCTNPVIKKGRIAATSARALFVEDVTNPAGGFTNAEYQAIANSFDNLIYPTDVANFGAPTDIDNNGKIIVFYTRAVNELTPPGANFIVGGFFFARDLFPKKDDAARNLGACPASNVSEIFYMLAVDPGGEVNGHIRSKAEVSESTIGTLAHEFEHLINASRRLYVNTNAEFPEQTWLDEGLAHIAEELAFYAASGLSPRSNVNEGIVLSTQARADAFNEYGRQNFGRFSDYLENPTGQSPTEDDDDLGTRGAAWSFLRYIADRRTTGGTDAQFWFALANSRDTGITNIANNTAQEPVAQLRDWTVANYTDDAVAGVEARFTQPSWNFRSVYSNAAFGGYPLQVTRLNSGAPVTRSIRAGSAGYFRFAVAAGATGDVRVSQGGTTNDAPCTPLALAVGQVYQGNPSGPSAFCLTSGATATDYVLIPFHASVIDRASLPVTVVATGIIASPPGGPNPSVSAQLSTRPAFSRTARDAGDGGFHMRLRGMERAELSDLARGGLRGRRQVTPAPPAADIRVQVVRIR